MQASDYDFLENSISSNKVRIIERLSYIGRLSGCANETSFDVEAFKSTTEEELIAIERKMLIA